MSLRESLGPVADAVERHDSLKIAIALGVVYVLITALVWNLNPNASERLATILGQLRLVTFFAAAYALLTLALNLHWGYTGLFNIGVAGFMAIGVYTMAILTRPIDPLTGPPGFGLPLWVGIGGGMLAAAILGFVAALPALRLRADYFAIVTLAISEIVRLTLQSSAFNRFLVDTIGVGTNGGSGIRLTQAPDDFVSSLFLVDGSIAQGPTALGDLFLSQVDGNLAFAIPGLGATISANAFVAWMYVFTLAVVAGAFFWFLTRLGRSPFGRVLKAIREDELVANSLGKNVSLAKIKVFMIGCALMGLAGILWQGSQGTVSPTPTFRPLITFYTFVAMMLGGSGSNTGSVIGGILFAGVLFEAPRKFGSLLRNSFSGANPATFADAVTGGLSSFLVYFSNNIAAIQFVILGVVLIAMMRRRPEGILGHRTEEAAAVRLSDRPVAADGGETDE